METSSEAYKEHLENKYLPGRDKYLHYIFYPKIIEQFSKAKILDLGCGTGEFLQFLKLNNRELSGIDNNPFLVEKCVNKGFDVKLDDVTKLENISENTENALCDNVLEHLDVNQIDMFFAAIKRKMAKGGKLVVIVPDKKGFQHDPTHKTFVNRQIIEEMCSKHNIQLHKNFYHPIDFNLFEKENLIFNFHSYRGKSNKKLLVFWSVDCNHCEDILNNLNNWISNKKISYVILLQ